MLVIDQPFYFEPGVKFWFERRFCGDKYPAYFWEDRALCRERGLHEALKQLAQGFLDLWFVCVEFEKDSVLHKVFISLVFG